MELVPKSSLKTKGCAWQRRGKVTQMEPRQEAWLEGHRALWPCVGLTCYVVGIHISWHWGQGLSPWSAFDIRDMFYVENRE
jgi:hypothetical protein